MAPKKDSSRKGDSGEDAPRGSFWTTLPGIFTGAAAVITAIVGLIGALNSLGWIGSRDSRPTAPAAVAPGIKRPAGPASPPGTPIAAGDCFVGFFEGIPAERVRQVETGRRDLTLIRPDQPKDPPLGIKFTEFNRPIGAIRLVFISANEIFKVERVVDAACRPVETFFNASRPADKDVLQNWDSLRVELGGQAYELRLGYSGGEIGGNFTKIMR